MAIGSKMDMDKAEDKIVTKNRNKLMKYKKASDIFRTSIKQCQKVVKTVRETFIHDCVTVVIRLHDNCHAII